MINWMNAWNTSFLGFVGPRLAQPVHKKHMLGNDFLQPLTAQQAWEQIEHIAKHYDSNIEITSISSDHVVEHGVSPVWVFQFDCLTLHAKGEIVWSLQWNGDCHHWSSCDALCQISPYPIIGSPIYNVASFGNSNLLDAAWKQMRASSVDVPDNFQDTNEVWDLFQGQCDIHLGRVIRFNTVVLSNTLYWEAQCADHNILIPVIQSGHLPISLQDNKEDKKEHQYD